jgi:hypothetical protein
MEVAFPALLLHKDPASHRHIVDELSCYMVAGVLPLVEAFSSLAVVVVHVSSKALAIVVFHRGRTLLEVVLPLSTIDGRVVSVSVGSIAVSGCFPQLALVAIPVAVEHHPRDELVLLPSAVENSPIDERQLALPVLLIIEPVANVLAFWTFEDPSSLLTIFDPVPLVKGIFVVIVDSIAFLVSVHPLAIVDDILPLTPIHRFSQQRPLPMLFACLKLTPVLQILLDKIIDPRALYILALPCTVISISVGKQVFELLLLGSARTIL